MPLLTPNKRSLILGLTLLAAGRAASADLAVGAGAPAFELQDLDGKAVTLAEFRGKTVVLEWINPNCPVSRGYAERKVMIQTAAAHPEAVWLAINSTSRSHRDFLAPAAHKAYDQKNGIGYPVLYDTSGEVGRAYGAKTTPHMFIVDENGKLAYNGAIDSGPGATSTNYVDAALMALAAGQRPDPATTQPMGCSVKYGG
ncbi:MAG: redoxin domain-containing protein [Thermoanaerobaculia bacterium]